MKKMLAIILTITLLISCLVACGATPAEETSAPETEALTPATSTEIDTPNEDDGITQPKGYPAKTINWIVPAAAGAAIDLPSRALTDVLDLGEPIVVENIAGASQTLGTAEASVRAADGYTLLTMGNACGITQPLMGGVAYELDDFRFLTMLTPYDQATICVKADSKLNSAEDFVEFIKNNEFVYGVPNAGYYGHIAAATAMKQLDAYDNGTLMVYSGSSENITAILNGEVDFAVVNASDAISRVEGGELKVLTILHNEKSALFPDTPIISDYGVENVGTFVGMVWVAIHADTPDEIVQWVKCQLDAATQSPEYQQYLDNMGFQHVPVYTEAELNALLATAAEEYGAVMRDIGMIE